LKGELAHNKQEDLEAFKDEVSKLLEDEIVTRYYYQKGRIQHSLSVDQEIAKALEILNDKDKQQAILTGKYSEPEPKD